MSLTDCPGCRRSADPGKDLIVELPHSLLLLGDHQYFQGYSVLWLKRHAREQHDLEPAELAAFMAELSRCSRAIAMEFGTWKINLASFGNQVGHLHWHIFPRFESDPDRFEHPWLHAERFAAAAGSEAERAESIERLRKAMR